jgi:protein-disulfide isomerase
VSERALFVIDPDSVIQWGYVSPIGVHPGADGILRALESFPEARMSLTIPVNEHDHTQGPPDAQVTLVEYADYQCPYCSKAYVIVEQLEDQFGSLLRFVFRNFPLTQIHDQAELAAEAAEAAGAQGKFWQMHNALYENQPLLGPDLIRTVAQELGLDMETFENDVESGKFRERIKHDFMGGVRSGVSGTPTFFINGELHQGKWDQAALSAAMGVELDK